MQKRRRYYVTTWDTNLQKFTPQPGVRTGPYTQFGLRKALRKLRDEFGYSARKGDCSTLVESPEAVRATIESFKRHMRNERRRKAKRCHN